MTGYGEAETQLGKHTLKVTIRSVNHRGLKVYSRLPEGWGAAEALMQKTIRKKILRGALECHVSIEGQDAAACRINSPLLKAYYQELSQLQQEIKNTTPLNLVDLCKLPGVLAANPDQVQLTTGNRQLKKTLDTALEGLVQMRAKEGAALQRALKKMIRNMHASLRKVKQQGPKVVKDYQSRLETRLQTLIGSKNVEISRTDLVREIAIFADRADISEELCRLESHFKQFESALELHSTVGKRLEFITQEMLREMNTIGAKANHIDITNHVIDCKAVLEKIREQLQNVE